MDSLTGEKRSPPWLLPRAAYLHIPFCAHHCGYCDFAVTAGQDHLQELYLDALEMELSSLGEPAPVETIFVGGGTPTYLNPSQLKRLMDAVNRWLPRQHPNPEFTIESTPDSVSEEKLRLLTEGGLTRISIGVQTFHGRLLPALDRIHSPEQVESVLELVRKFPLQVSLDLIFGIPGQTLDEWQRDLTRAIELGIHHVSTYGLTYEKGTPLWKQRQHGKVLPVTEDLEADMYALAMDYLEAHGYEHYEISNFARPGGRCRHNETYWANHAYYGFGVGAARYVQGSRELNVRNTQDYIRRVLSGESPTFQTEELDTHERSRETVAVQLRRREGIDRAEFESQTSTGLDALIGRELIPLVEQGLLIDDGKSIRLSRRGKCVGDGVIVQLMK